MADTVVKTVEDVDRLFSQIVVNGETYNSDRYVPPAPVQVIEEPEPEPQQTEISQNPSVPSGQTIQGEDVYAVVLNDEQHNFVDPEEVTSRTEADTTLQGNINSINALIPSDTSTSNKLVNESGIQDAVDTAVENAVADLDVPQAGGNGKYIKAISETNGKISATEGTIATAVESGNNNPVTSDAVNSALAGVSGDVTQEIADAIGALDVASAGGSGKYISAISEADGKISATASDIATTVASGNNNPVSSDAVDTALNGIAGDVTQEIADAVNALDVASIGGSGKFIQSISETDGKISANEGTIDNTVTQNSSNPVTGGAVKTAIDNAISSVYKPAGDKTVAQLTSALLVAGNLGNVYNITDSGTTTSDFVEGAGHTINAGDNVAVVDVGTSSNPSYKFDLIGGFIDLSDYIQKSQTQGLVKNDGSIDTTRYNGEITVSNDTSALTDSDSFDETPAGTNPTATKRRLLSSLWTYIKGKITGAISAIVDSNLTASRALVSDANGKVAVSDVTSTELGYLDGVTSAIQTQLNGKQATLTFDDVPTANSSNPVTSGGVYTALASAGNDVTYDTTITDCNNAFEIGKTKTYWLSTTVANVPNTTQGWYVISQCNSSTISSNAYVTQIATSASNVASSEVYVRHRYVSSYSPELTMSWTSWKKLVNTEDLSNALALPTDSVLHYSFDEVPDYPDGSADYKKIKNFTDTSGWNNNSTSSLSVENGGLKISASGTVAYVQVSGTYTTATLLSGKILKMKFHSNRACVFTTNDNGSPWASHSFNWKNVGGFNYVAEDVFGTFTVNQLFSFTFGGTPSTSDYVIIDEIYIGDGSYNTPVIDNANGQWNGTNYGSIPVQGVSGKAIKSFLDTYKPIKNNDFKKAPPYSYSVWVKVNANFTVTQYIIDGRDGMTEADEGILFLANKSIEVGSTGGQFVQTDNGAVPIGEWFHLAVITTVEGSGNRYKIYKNGSLIKEGVTTVVNQGFKRLTINGRYEDYAPYSKAERQVDDFLFFDRALSDTEVLALYQNKANTPKYFPIPTNEIKQNSWELATSGGVFNALANKADKVSGATAGNLAGLDAGGNLTDSGIDGSALIKGSSVTISEAGGVRYVELGVLDVDYYYSTVTMLLEYTDSSFTNDENQRPKGGTVLFTVENCSVVSGTADPIIKGVTYKPLDNSATTSTNIIVTMDTDKKLHIYLKLYVGSNYTYKVKKYILYSSSSFTDTISVLTSIEGTTYYNSSDDILNRIMCLVPAKLNMLPQSEPVANGTYVLKCVKDSSGRTYCWVKES